MNLPDYNFLSAPLWLITTLHVVTLTLHLLAMNIVLGGIFVLLTGRASGKWHDASVRRVVRLIPSVMAATVTLGVAPLLFLQLVYNQQAYSAAITSGWLWLLIVAAVIVAYYLLYGAAFTVDRRPPTALLVLALMGLLYVSWVYSTVFSMAERPDLYRALYAADQSGWAINNDVGTWGIRWLHMLTGAVAVGGFAVGVIGRGSDPVYRIGRTLFLWGTIAAYVAGTVYLLTRGEHLSPLMKSPAIWILTGAIVLSAGALHFFFKKRFAAATAMVVVSMMGMVLVRHMLRLIVLAGHFDPAITPVSPQWGVFAVFLACFVVALALVAYMLRLLAAGRATSA